MEFKRRLALLSADHVRAAYRRALEECRMDCERLPQARAVQELVQVWEAPTEVAVMPGSFDVVG